MHTLRRLVLLAVSLPSLLLSAGASAQLATLVADLNTSSALFDRGSTPGSFVTLGSRLVFLAGQPTLGLEWWATDGTATGTELLADSCPAECSVSRFDIVGPVAGRLAWLARGGISSPPSYDGYWVTDGTRAGTYPLHGPELSLPQDPEAVMVDGLLLFAAADEAHGRELFVADLETGSARLVRDIRPGEESSFPRSLGALGNGILFIAVDPVHGAGLWKSDGTTAGTTFVVRFELPVERVIPLGPRALLVVETGSFDYRLWVTDGTAGGTFDLPLPGSASGVGDIPILEVIEGKAYFRWDDGQHGSELWETDGSRPGTRRISDLPASEVPASFSGDQSVARLGSHILFLTSGDFGERLSLWRSDGNPDHTTRLGETCTDCGGTSHDSRLVPTAARVFFLGRDPIAGRELWVSDGTPEGTGRAADSCPGPCGEARDLTGLGGEAYFIAQDLEGRNDLWRAEADGSGATNLTDFHGRASFDDIFEPLQIGLLGDDLYFRASTPESGEELWVSTQTPGTARLFADLVAGSESSEPGRLADFHGALLFAADDGQHCPLHRTLGTAATTTVLTGPEQLSTCLDWLAPIVVAGSRAVFMAEEPDRYDPRLWGTDGTPGAAVPLTDNGLPVELAVVGLGAHAYFFLDGEDSATLWRTDGTAPGTVALFELPEGGAWVQPRVAMAATVGPHIYFEATASPSFSQHHLWRTDGTAAGTERLTGTPYHRSSYSPLPLAVVGDQVFFVWPRGFALRQVVWGSTGGEDQEVRTFYPNQYSPGILQLVALDGAIYLMAGVNEHEIALWKSDGTFAGTVPLRRFPSPGTFGSWQHHLTAFGDRLVFVADDGEHGRELWTSDGTAEGTALLADLNAGALSSNPEQVTVVGGRIFFTANNGIHGRELWTSEGTAAGTRLVHDLLPGAASSNPEQLTAAGGRLYFSADDQYRGRELWSLDVAAPAGVCVPSDGSLCLSGGRFRVEVAWKDFQNRRGEGHAVPLTSDTGYFWFFNPANVEAIVKVLDGRPLNGHFWTFYGALSSVEYALTVSDAATGLARRYFNPSGQLASVGDTASFGPLGAAFESFTPPPEDLALPWEPPIESLWTRTSTGACAPSSTRLCLNGNRFAVEAAWRDFQGNTGVGTAVVLTPDTGYFWFFRDTNVEVVLKVLDGRPLNGRFWVFYGALSSVEYTLTVTDTVTGAVKIYANPSGRFASVGDTGGFSP